MTATDPALTALAQGWCALSALHGRIEAHIERALQAKHDLSVREYSLLDVLSRQHDGDGGHLQMKQVADAVVLSQSATTRLVTRLEDRGLLERYLCPTDRYVLWLVPLAVLARPKWRDFLIWQACEVAYFLGIWLYLAYTTSGDAHKGLPTHGYHWTIVLHLLGTLYLCAVVVRDILMPERDVVRRSGDDDPSGGVLDGAEDVFVLGAAAHPPRHAAHPDGPPVDWGRPEHVTPEGRSL
jgi:DNA-binding Lrp family transcriptional regulator